MKEKWEIIENWLAEHAPEIKANLNPPATEVEIAEAESTLGVGFPTSVRESYRVHNGESGESDGLFGLWRLLPLDKVVARSKELATLSKQYSFNDFDPGLMIPILESSGDFQYVESSKAGEESPVFEWWHESPSRETKAPGFGGFVDAFIEKLRRNGYVYLPGELKGLIDADEL